jgi:hypothetical protein
MPSTLSELKTANIEHGLMLVFGFFTGNSDAALVPGGVASSSTVQADGLRAI